MTISESDRLEMHLKLRSVLGDDVANTLMEHLPPSGWGDVARKSDIDHVITMMDARFDAVHERFNAMEARFTSVDARFDAIDTRFTSMEAQFTSVDARFDAIDARFTSMEARFTSVDARFDMMQSQIDGLRHAMWALAAITTSGFFGMFALIVTKL